MTIKMNWHDNETHATTIKERYFIRASAKARVEELKSRIGVLQATWYRGHRNFIVQYQQEDK